MIETILLKNRTDSEQLILAATLVNNSLFELVAARLKAEDFQNEFHRLVFCAMQSAFERGAPLNAIVLACEANYIEHGKKLCTVADIECLTSNHPHYVDLTREIETVRESVEKCTAVRLGGCSVGILPTARTRDAIRNSRQNASGTNCEVEAVKKVNFPLVVQNFQSNVTSKAFVICKNRTQHYKQRKNSEKMRLQKNRILGAALSALMFVSALPVATVRAEEGMFMMDKVATLPLAQKGLKISPAEIYKAGGGGLSEAVIRLDSGCTAEFVSPDGLILTNHHCAFDALVAASTPEKNYGENGYKADNRETELPAKNTNGTPFTLTITLKQEDVTAQVLNGINRDDAAAVKARIEQLTKEEQARAGADVAVAIQALNNGLYYYRFNTTTIKDMRIVYAPPKSIGFYGGDPDNFEWTRHCGDFTFMRAYVGRDGKAAEYSKDNVPYKPKKHLSFNAEGVKENDFTMIIGFPGGTTRYREAASVAFNQDVRLPFLVEYLQTYVDAWETVGKTNPAKKVALQADIFSYMNSIKAFDGGVVAMRRANLVGQKQADEARFRQWIAQDASRQTKYGAALDGLNGAYADYLKTARRDLIMQFMLNVAPVGFAFGALSGQADKAELKGNITDVLKSEPLANREVLKFFLRKAAELPAEQRIAAIEKRFGSLQGDARRQAESEFAARSLEGQTFTTENGLNAILNGSAQDPLLDFLKEVTPELPAVFAAQQKFNAAVSKHRLPYTQGMIEMKNLIGYPDANFTQRFTYGAVKGYSPKEAVTYTPFTTLNGVFEKDTGREPFNAPAKLRDLWQRKDYGSYNVNGSVPLNFLTTNDIIGGNSGSPVLNANGEQVGIAFDGNYEGLGNDFFFSDALGRTIVVDIRYVMFITEKFGDAGWVLNEIDIKGRAKAASAKR
jgi:hypothetical protein